MLNVKEGLCISARGGLLLIGLLVLSCFLLIYETLWILMLKIPRKLWILIVLKMAKISV